MNYQTDLDLKCERITVKTQSQDDFCLVINVRVGWGKMSQVGQSNLLDILTYDVAQVWSAKSKNIIIIDYMYRSPLFGMIM